MRSEHHHPRQAASPRRDLGARRRAESGAGVRCTVWVATVGTIRASTYGCRACLSVRTAGAKWSRRAGRRNGVGDRKVDADTADRRHGRARHRRCTARRRRASCASWPSRTSSTFTSSHDVTASGVDSGTIPSCIVVECVEPTARNRRSRPGNQVRDLKIAFARNHDQRAPGFRPGISEYCACASRGSRNHTVECTG